MKILMLLSNPFMVDPRVYKEAKSLVDNGYEVSVIVWDRKGDYPSEDRIDGIRIIRIHNNLLMKIMPNDLFRNPLWWRRAYKKGLEMYRSNQFKFDIVHCHDLDTLQSGVWLKKRLWIKLIYDAHEIFGYMISRDMPKIVVNASFLMEKRLIKNVDHVITVDKGYADYFKTTTNKPLTIVRNCKDLTGDYKPPFWEEFTLIYIGVLQYSRFFPQIVNIIGQMKNVKLIIGAKKEGIYNEIEKLSKNFENIEFLGSIPFDKVIPLTRECHAIICMFDPNDKLKHIGSPNKVFEAMVTGRPIIVTKGTYAGNIIEQEQCGLVVQYTETAVKEAIEKLRDDPILCEKLGRSGLKAAQGKYNWRTQEKELLKVYEEVVGHSRKPKMGKQWMLNLTPKLFGGNIK